MRAQFPEILRIAGYEMAICCEPLGAQFAQAFQGRRGCDRGYEGTWELQDGRLYLVKLVGTLRNRREASVATFFPNSPDRVFANWYSGPLIEPDVSQAEYMLGPICVYDCDLFIKIEMGLVSEAYLSRAGGPKDHQAAAERYGIPSQDTLSQTHTTRSESSELPIESADWWVKPIEMLCHNWALIGPDKNGCVTVYFFHDAPPANPLQTIARSVRVIDSLKFSSQTDAMEALKLNGFMEVERSRERYPELDWGLQPIGRYYYPHPEAKGIYSSGQYWVSSLDKVNSFRNGSG